MNSRIFPLCVIILFVAIQSALFAWHSFPLARYETDGLHYMAMSSGKLFQLDAYHGPGYSTAIRLIRKTGVSPFAAAKLVSMASGIIFVISLWIILQRIFSPSLAMAGLVIATINKSVIVCSNIILSDMLASACFIASIAIIIIVRRPGWGYYFAAGVLGGIAYLTRYIFIIELALPLLSVIIISPLESVRKKTAWVAAFIIGFIVVAAPWFLYLYNLKGNIFWNQNHLNIAFKIIRGDNGWRVFPDVTQFHNLKDVIFWNPSLFFISWIRTASSFPEWVLKLFPVTGILAFVGVYKWIRTPSPVRILLGSISCIYALFLSLVWIEYRFLLPLVPICSLLIIDGCEWIWSSHLKRLTVIKRKRIVSISTLLAVLLIITVPALIHTAKRFKDIPTEYQVVSDWLKNHSRPEDLILAGKPHIAFFSRTRNMEFRNAGMDMASWKDFPEILRRQKPTYVIFDERYAQKSFPQFNRLLAPATKPYPNLLEHVYTVKSPQKIVVYKTRLSSANKNQVSIKIPEKNNSMLTFPLGEILPGKEKSKFRTILPELASYKLIPNLSDFY